MSDAVTSFQAHHDMGGLPADAIDQAQHDYAFWEKRVDALLVLLSREPNPYIRVDELRRAIESLGPDVYDRLNYYDRWISAISIILLEKGVVDETELNDRIAQLKKQHQAAT